MKRQDIGISDFKLASFNAWNPDSLLLTAGGGGPGQYNCMTVGWGSIGFIWKRPFVCVVVRPSRFTYSFIESHRDFTLSAFPPQHREILSYCGGHSGRDVDKVAVCGLTPIESSKVETPGFDQAELIVECRKVYYDDLEPTHFLDASILDNYPKKDFHRMYFGEILAIRGTDKYVLNR